MRGYLEKLLDLLRLRGANPLRVTATRHPNPDLASWLLVRVEDDNGPVTGLSKPNFSVNVWATTMFGTPGGGPGIAYWLDIDQVSTPIIAPGPLFPNGFYELQIAALPGSGPTEEEPQGSPPRTPQDLGALVYAVIVTRQAGRRSQFGEAIAATPSGY